ncbi:hypothetical protein [Vibrio phage VCPH]|nr:hypothetical protein [Vibrio phage VCPH]
MAMRKVDTESALTMMINSRGNVKFHNKENTITYWWNGTNFVFDGSAGIGIQLLDPGRTDFYERGTSDLQDAFFAKVKAAERNGRIEADQTLGDLCLNLDNDDEVRTLITIAMELNKHFGVVADV